MTLVRGKFTVILLVSIVWGTLSGCVVKYPVLGKFVSASEVFSGNIISRYHPQEGLLEIRGETSRVKCVGRSNIAVAPPGKEGRVALACQDGKRILANYRVLAWGKGHGTGTDQGGKQFVFTFGMSPDEASKYLRKSQP